MFINSSNKKQPIDLERKPLLYDYYANTLNPIYDKRNFDEIDRYGGMSGLNGKRNFDEIDRVGMNGIHKRNFDEIDRTPLSSLERKRSNMNMDRYYKRNSMDMVYLADQSQPKAQTFNEIDRSAYTDFMKRYFDGDRTASDIAKRNFDEIDRHGMSGLNGKRNFDEIDRFGPGNFFKRNFEQFLNDLQNQQSPHRMSKKNFDEIDRVGFSGLKRTVRNVETAMPVKTAPSQQHTETLSTTGSLTLKQNRK